MSRQQAPMSRHPTPEDTSDIDHRMVEEIRSRGSLRSITLRLGEEQIAEARRLAARTGTPYQTILRRWISVGAAEAQAARRRKRTKR